MYMNSVSNICILSYKSHLKAIVKKVYNGFYHAEEEKSNLSYNMLYS